ADLASRYPERVAHVPAFGYGDDAHDNVDQRLDDLFGQQGTVAIRFGALPRSSSMPDRFNRYVAGEFDAVFMACGQQGIPIWLEVMGGVASVDRVARAYPQLQIIVDHFGLNQPPYQARDVPPWKDLPTVLALARCENVAIKMCAPIALSDQAYPWAD